MINDENITNGLMIFMCMIVMFFGFLMYWDYKDHIKDKEHCRDIALEASKVCMDMGGVPVMDGISYVRCDFPHKK